MEKKFQNKSVLQNYCAFVVVGDKLSTTRKRNRIYECDLCMKSESFVEDFKLKVL